MTQHDDLELHNMLVNVCRDVNIAHTGPEYKGHQVLSRLMRQIHEGDHSEDPSKALQAAGLPKHAADRMAEALHEYDEQLHPSAAKKR